MSTFLTLAFSFPTAIFTTLLIVMLLYWLLVLVGAVGLDLGHDGALEAKAGVLDAKAGLLDAKAGLAHGLEAKAGAADAHAGHVHADHAQDGVEGKGGIGELLGLGTVPATMIATFLTVWGWITSMVGAYFAGPALAGFVGTWLAGTVILFGALVCSVALSGVTAKPLKPLFTIRTAPKRRSLLGKVATVASLRVDANFGQATMEDGGAGLVLSVFCEGDNQLKKGDQILLLEFDEKKDAYEIEPVDWLMPEEAEQLKDPRTAASMARARLAKESRKKRAS